MAGAEIGVSSTNVTPSSGRLAPGKLSWAFALIICRERQPLLHGNLFHTVRFSLVCTLLWSVTVCKIPICIWTRAFERQRGNAGERPSRRSEVINERTHSWAWNGWGNEASLWLILLLRILFSVLFYVWRSVHFYLCQCGMSLILRSLECYLFSWQLIFTANWSMTTCCRLIVSPVGQLPVITCALHCVLNPVCHRVLLRYRGWETESE